MKRDTNHQTFENFIGVSDYVISVSEYVISILEYVISISDYVKNQNVLLQML